MEVEEEDAFAAAGALSTLLPAGGNEEEWEDDEKKERFDKNSGSREVCWEGCGRPSRVCICRYLPAEPISTSTVVLILHHPHELRRPLSTVPPLSRSLCRCLPIPGRRLGPSTHPLLHSLYRNKTTSFDRPPAAAAAAFPPVLYLFPGSDLPIPAVDLHQWAAETPRAMREEPVLIAFDGTWRHAKEMVAASLPFLSIFATRVTLGMDGSTEGESSYESELVLRKEPYKGCVSTMEAVARALRVLEPETKGAEVERKLLEVLKAMVGFQRCHMTKKPMKPRVKLQKKSNNNEEYPSNL